MNRAAIYLRVSSAKQAGDDRASLPVQLEACTCYAHEHGWEVAATAEDHESGKNVTRSGYQHLLDLARKDEIDHIVVYAPERFGRKAWEVLARREEMDELGVDVHAVTKEMRDWLSMAINAVIGENELKVMRARVGPALKYKAMQGHWLRNAPWGLKKDPELKGNLIKARDFDQVEVIFRLCAQGLPLKQIAERVNHVLAQRAPDYHQNNRKHTTLSFGTVRNIVLNPAYEGKVVWPGVDAEGLWGRLIDADLITKARAVLHARALTRAPISPSYPYWIVGMAFCPHCERQLIPKVSTKKNGKVYAYLVCSRMDRTTLARTCTRHTRIEDAQEWLVEQVRGYHVREGSVVGRLEGIEAARLADIAERSSDHRAEIERLEARLERGEAGYLNGVISAPRLKALQDGIGSTLKEHRQMLAELERNAESREDYSAMRHLLENAEWLESRHVDPAGFRFFIRFFIHKVIVRDDGFEAIWSPAIAGSLVDVR